MIGMRPSQKMTSIGIIQEGEAILRRRSALFDLPGEADQARAVIAELESTLGRVAAAHTFAKGMGIAAPQIGVDRSAALVRSADGQLIVLLNPAVAAASDETDEQFEGCLSFFDVRGRVARPLRITVLTTGLDGTTSGTVFANGLARLIAHEIDHLNGVLYTDLQPDGARLIPVEEYRGTGNNWAY
jgi:peptide deformylase